MPDSKPDPKQQQPQPNQQERPAEAATPRMTETEAHTLAGQIWRAHYGTWEAYAVLARDMLNWSTLSWVVIAMHPASGKEYVIERPEDWPNVEAQHVTRH